jgi:hypothetical protein
VRVRFLQAVGVPDDVRTEFETQTAYQVGTLRVLINGLFRDPDFGNGFVEGTPPVFEMKVAPREGDTIWTFYREV